MCIRDRVKDENITVVWVPGAYELPLAAGALAKTGKYDAVIALGTVIRGGTAHFEYVAGGASNGPVSYTHLDVYKRQFITCATISV